MKEGVRARRAPCLLRQLRIALLHTPIGFEWEVKIKRTGHTLLRLAVPVLVALWCEVQPALSQDRVFANPSDLANGHQQLS